MKYCKDCDYFDYYAGELVCLKTLKIIEDPIYGKCKEYENPEACRLNEDLCGKEGKWFKAVPWYKYLFFAMDGYV